MNKGQRLRKWGIPLLYLAIFGSYCGLEIDSFIGDLPFFQIRTLLIFVNALFVLLIPILLYLFVSSIQRLWTNRPIRIATLALTSVYFHFAAFIAIYKSVRKMDFDFYLIWYNIADTLPTLWKLFAPWFPIVAISITVYALFQKQAYAPLADLVRKSPRKAGSILAGILVLSGLCQVLTLNSIRGSASGFIYSSFLSDRRLRNDYREFYQKNIAELQADKPITGKEFDPSVLGDFVFVVKQESLNGLLTGPKVTPQLMRAAEDGIMFPKLYGNSVQSLRGYECILCGAPPSAARDLVDDYPPEEIKKLSCLPKLFKELGYRTLYFFGGSRNPRIVQFARSAGFERVLADEIMQPEDTRFDWGYREDIFYTRVDQFLQKHYRNEKLFVFIDTGATNHTPFKVLDKALLNRIPFPDPHKFEENLSNTTFVQDAYFGSFYDLFKKRYAPRGSLIAVSDHAWPIPIHKYNIYNERGAYEENFLASLLFVPPSEGRIHFNKGTTVTQRYSQMDLLPTILDLLGMEEKSLLGESFAPWLLATPNGKRLGPMKAKISIQPYGGGYISIVRYPEKYLFDVLGSNVHGFDLEKDPEEKFPTARSIEESMPLIREFFKHP
jgi:hypothetical protein